VLCSAPGRVEALHQQHATVGRRRYGLLRTAHHWVNKTPEPPRSDQLWHPARCSAGIGAGHVRRDGPLPAVLPPQASDYVLLHRDTGAALYATRATEVEIQRANDNLRRAGNRNRYVAARHLMDHRQGRQG
jgi:hypothetical protein